jgi:peptidoglycan/xylan/chitin deacetylase (PgdA/CDA1 family)
MWPQVYHVLRTRHMTGTFFVAPGLLSTPRYMTWTQVWEMQRHGMDIEAHTMTHPDLTLVPAAQAWGEISGSRQVLRQRLHAAPTVFAYPYGSYNARILADVRRAGYLGAFTTHQGWWQDAAQAFTLPRVYVDRDDSLADFAGRLVANPRALAKDPS